MFSCDIVLPMHNNDPILPATLQALFAQSSPPGWRLRLLLSDDGSTDRTLDRAREIGRASPWPVKLITGPHGGPAAARNRALTHAVADIIFFLGADILLRPGAVATHLAFHEAHPAADQAALGVVKWDPRLPPTPLMEWLMHGGPQNDFDSLLGTAISAPAHAFYASHLSLKRAVLPQPAFAEEYRGYGWEDLDLGRRLTGRLTLYVLHQAIGLHHHRYHAAAVLQRQRTVGRQLLRYQSRFPQAALIPVRSPAHRRRHAFLYRLGLLACLRFALRQRGDFQSLPRLFSLSTAAEFWSGLYTAPAYPQNRRGYPHNYPQ